MKTKFATYLPGLILLFFALIIGFLTYQDYGLSWDAREQREIGEVSYRYIVKDDQRLITYNNNHHGVGFELPLYCLEQTLNISDSRNIFLMRYLVTHIFFLLCAFVGYLLMLRTFKNQFIACLGFFMLVFAPRIYAHSFFNSKDIPLLGMFIVSFAFSHLAFEKKKVFLFFILGCICGYTTSIRILGIILAGTILLFLLTDVAFGLINKERPAKPVFSTLLFIFGFCITLYLFTPFLWKAPIRNFIYTYNSMAHYPWNGKVLFMGALIHASELPWYYAPVWILISTPELWIVTGICGILLVAVNFFKKPLPFLKNTPERSFLLYLSCFFVPVLAVIFLHSVVYDDWRHLYFVYPAFVMLALYFINKATQTRYKKAVQAICILQVGFTSYFLVIDHPFQQVYFNSFVSHRNEFLHKNYELDYWGCSYKQAFDYILSKNQGDHIRIFAYLDKDGCPMKENIQLLQKRDRSRIEFTDSSAAEYFVTIHRTTPDDIDYKNLVYSIRVHNSTILTVNKLH